LELHKGRVFGVAIDRERDQLYTIAEDKKLNATDMLYQKTHTMCLVGTTDLTALEYDSENKRLLVLNASGEVFIFSVIDKAPKVVKQLALGSNQLLRGIHADIEHNFLFTCIFLVYMTFILKGAYEGTITMLDISVPGKEKLVKVLGTFKGQEKARCLEWRPSKVEVIVGHENGRVVIWQTQYGAMTHIFEPHKDAITKLQWDEKNQILLTAGKDKSLKIWKFPERWYPFIWMDPEKPKPKFLAPPHRQESKNEEEKKPSEKEDLDIEEDSNSEDDLKGWDK